MVSSISQEEEGLVTVLDEGRHGLEDGDFVTFTEVKGMAELNGCEPKQVKVKPMSHLQALLVEPSVYAFDSAS